MTLDIVWGNINYLASVVLFCIGLYVIIAKDNLIKKFLGLNIMHTSVFMFIIALSAVDEGHAPIMAEGAVSPFANPLPQALVLTGIVVAVSTTALALSLVIRIYRHCDTIEANELRELE